MTPGPRSELRGRRLGPWGLFLPGICPQNLPSTKSETLEALDDEKVMLTGPDQVVAGSGSGPKTSD